MLDSLELTPSVVDGILKPARQVADRLLDVGDVFGCLDRTGPERGVDAAQGLVACLQHPLEMRGHDMRR